MQTVSHSPIDFQILDTIWDELIDEALKDKEFENLILRELVAKEIRERARESGMSRLDVLKSIIASCMEKMEAKKEAPLQLRLQMQGRSWKIVV